MTKSETIRAFALESKGCAYIYGTADSLRGINTSTEIGENSVALGLSTVAAGSEQLLLGKYNYYRG